MINKSRLVLTLVLINVLTFSNIQTVASMSLDEIKDKYSIPNEAELLHYDEYYVVFTITDYENCLVTLVVIVLIPGTIVHVGGDICDSYCEYLLDYSSSHTIIFWAEFPDGNVECQYTMPLLFPDCTSPTVTITSPENALIFNNKKLINLKNSICVGPISIIAAATDAGGIQFVLFELSNGETHYDIEFPYEFLYNRPGFGKLTVNVTAIDYAGHKSTTCKSFLKIF